ncbi:MAG: ATP-dependent DNA helicase [Chitinophagaceae bacterium]
MNSELYSSMSQLNKYNNAYLSAYNKLNADQRRAVDQIEGPVMVIAGPGTGKTQILSARIGKILLDTDTQPGNILCLTYTDAGVVAMRKRLISFIGPDAYKVNIYTFHAFCNDVIQENLSLFEKNALDPISNLEKMQLFKTLIDELPKNHPLKKYRGDVYFDIPGLQYLYSVMKREGWTPAFINSRVDEYIHDLPNRDEYRCKRATGRFRKGDIRTDKIEEEMDRMEKFRAAVNEFANLQELMRKKNRYDFDDMINWVLEAFEKNNNLLANYQEKYQYILVDEYQDTSGTQNRLVQILIDFWEKPNIFVVGDDDQSIFRFQGANVENMHEFHKSYANDLLTVVLTNNYRSVQSILNISKSLIDSNTERLIKRIEGLSKELISSNTQISHLTHEPYIREYESQRHEMVDVTNTIHSLLGEGTQPGRIAVIYKENKYGEELLRYFRLKGMPAYAKRSINILELPFAKKIIQILRYLSAEHDIPYSGDEMLFEIMHYDFYNIPPIEIAKVTVEANAKKQSGTRGSIRQLLQDKVNTPPKDLFDVTIYPALGSLSNRLERLVSDVSNATIQTLFERIIRQAGVLNYIMKSDEKIWLLQVLTALFDFIKDETRRNPEFRLQELIETIDLMIANKIPVPLIEISGTDKGVNLLTVHGSKGLEYEYIFFVGCNASWWEKKRKQNDSFAFPDTMFSSLASSSEDEELRRLFYVALTRAEKYLYISYARFELDGKDCEPSMFIEEILKHHDILIEKVYLDKETLLEYEMLQYNGLPPQIEKAETDFINNLLDKFVMNVTALNNYLQCPLAFYYNNLIRIPSGKSEAAEFGSAVHFALQQLFEKMKERADKQFPSKTQMLEDFNWFMNRHRENFTGEAFSRRLEYGQEVLINYYDNYILSWNTVVAVERNIRNVVVRGVPLKGKLDKLEFYGKEVNVVDYKTGDVEKAKDKLKQPSDKFPNGGDYWRQAVFYKILIDHYADKDWKVVSTEFDFIEPDKKGEYRKERIFIRPQDTETVTQQLVDVWTKIQQRDFYTGCGKKDCHWCNFVKDNKLSVVEAELEEELE